jgi:hypothetical protein
MVMADVAFPSVWQEIVARACSRRRDGIMWLLGEPVMSLEQYEDDESARRRLLSNREVLGFIAGYWKRRPWLVAITVVLTLAAIGF